MHRRLWLARGARRKSQQGDIIPATGTDYFTTNIEDGIAIADEALHTVAAAGAMPNT